MPGFQELTQGAKEQKQRAREFVIDTHIVADNFLGEHNWQWIRDRQDIEGQAKPQSKCERFKDEMMQGARFYTNDSSVEDRIALGIAASLYSAPYFAVRLPWDGVLNAIEYGSYRITGHAKTPLHPEGRKQNARIIGIPVSAPLIGGMVAVEAGLRAAGVSAYGAHVVQAAGKSSANMLSRYTGKSFTTDDLKPHHEALKAPVTNGWDVVNRAAYVALPGAIAAATVVGAAGLGAGARVVEGAGRGLGFTPYGGHIMAAAGKQSANMLSRYTGKSFTTDDLKPHHEALKAPVKNVWDVTDRAAYVTLPGAVAAATVVGAAGLGAGVRVVEGTGRVLGFTPYGGHIMAAAGKQSANMLSRYTGKSFTTDDLKPHHEALKAPVKNVWDVADRAAYVTLPGAIAAATVVGAAGLSAGVRVVEGAGRGLGFTPYGGHIMAAAGKQSANMLSRYTGKSFTTDDLKPHHEALKAPVKNVWDVTDRAAYVTLPGAIAAATVVGAAGLGAGVRVVEGAGRGLGFTPYGGHIMAAAGKQSANMLSRYTGKSFATDDLKPHHEALKAPVKNVWDVTDRAAYVTLPGAVAAATVVGAAGLGAGVRVVEGTGRVLGFTPYGGHIMAAAGKQSANMLSRYTGKSFTTDDLKPHHEALKAPVKNVWDVTDRAAYVTLPGAIAAATVVGAAGLGAGVRVVEGTGRALGFTPYGGHIMAAAGKQSANMLSRYTGKSFTTDDLKPHHEALKAPVKNVWDVADRAAYVTLPGAVAAATVIGAAGLGAGVRVVEGAGRGLGFTSYGGHIMAAAGKQSANMLSRYTGKSFTTDDLKPHHEALKAPVKNVWDVIDRAAYVTLPGAVAAATVIGAAGLGAGVRVVEGAGRGLGFTSYGGHIMAAAGKQSANMLSRYTGKSFTTDDLKPHHEALKAPVKNVWDVTDRAAYVTLPGAVAVATVVGAAGLGAGVRIVEGTGRALGLTSYSGHMLTAASMRSANMLSRYTRKSYNADDLKPHHDALKAPAKNGWDIADRAAYVTIPGAIAASELTLAAGLGLGGRIGEATGRALGMTKYGVNIVAAAGKRSANMLSRYTDKSFTTDDLKPEHDVLTAPVESVWDVADRVAYVTVPGAVAAATVVGAAGLGAGMRVVEGTGRALGFTSYGGQIMAAAGKQSANMLSRYTGKSFTTDDLKSHHEALKAPVKNVWDVTDRAAYVTLPGAVAAATVVGTAGLGAGIRVVEGTGRALGFTSYGGQIMAAAGKQSANMLSRYTGKSFTTDDLKPHHEALKAPVKNVWDVTDRAAYVTLPGAVAAATVVGAAGLGAGVRVC